MKRLAAISTFSAVVLFCGCAGAPPPVKNASTLTPPSTSQTTPNIVGNWQFDLVSTTPGTPALTIAGGISQNGTAVSGALHVDGSKCVDRLTTIGFSGTLSAGTTSLTSVAVDGQVVTLTGKFSNTAFAGTYKIKGGCADGEAGNVTGENIPYIGNTLAGTFTSSANKAFDANGDISQSSSASADGSFGVSGTAAFDTPCFQTGTVRSGTSSSGSFVLGRSLVLEFETANGILTFVGTLGQDFREIHGSYTVSGGTCSDDGTAVLNISSPWDY